MRPPPLGHFRFVLVESCRAGTVNDILRDRGPHALYEFFTTSIWTSYDEWNGVGLPRVNGVTSISELSPPFSSPWDPVQMAAQHWAVAVGSEKMETPCRMIAAIQVPWKISWAVFFFGGRTGDLTGGMISGRDLLQYRNRQTSPLKSWASLTGPMIYRAIP